MLFCWVWLWRNLKWIKRYSGSTVYVRPFTIGCKNFVLIESSNGAKASAILYSLVETAKANMINIFEYFNLLLTEIPQHMKDKGLSFIDDLLPWSSRVQKKCPSKYKKSWFFNVFSISIKFSQSPLKMRGFLLSSTHVWGFSLLPTSIPITKVFSVIASIFLFCVFVNFHWFVQLNV